MYTKTITELSLELEKRSISSVELTETFLKRIQHLDPALNSFITINEENALEQAQQADDLRAKNKHSRLTGIPIAHKDIFCTKGLKTSCASKMLDNFIAPYDATVIEKCRNDGMVMLGKTNMDEFAMGSSNETSYYGSVKNPWDTSRVPGGSSGGSAAAVAAYLSPAATGTDTGGSIRQPASFCGLTGLKPTYGTVSRYGMIAFASSLDQAGPMTHTAEDAALLMNCIAGFDEKDSTSIDKPHEDYTDNLDKPLNTIRIGLPEEYFNDALDNEIATLIEDAIKEFEKLGVSVKKVSLPDMELSIPAYYVVAPAECSSNLSRYDGVRFGYRCKDPKDLTDLYCRTRSEAFGQEVKRRIMIGTYALSAGYYDAYYLKAQQIRRLIKNEFQKVLEEVDVIISPTTPTTAFKLDEKTNDPVSMYLSDIYTVSVNLAGLPAISIPVGYQAGLPVGLQIIGDYFSEPLLLNMAHKYQGVTDWHLQIPEGFE